MYYCHTRTLSCPFRPSTPPAMPTHAATLVASVPPFIPTLCTPGGDAAAAHTDIAAGVSGSRDNSAPPWGRRRRVDLHQQRYPPSAPTPAGSSAVLYASICHSWILSSPTRPCSPHPYRPPPRLHSLSSWQTVCASLDAVSGFPLFMC